VKPIRPLLIASVADCAAGRKFQSLLGRTFLFEDVKMHIIRATGALKKFLDAREQGASQELLTKLGAEAMAEQESELAKAQRLRLVVDNKKPTTDEVSDNSTDAVADNSTDLAG
jgi:hypothetical protein